MLPRRPPLVVPPYQGAIFSASAPEPAHEPVQQDTVVVDPEPVVELVDRDHVREPEVEPPAEPEPEVAAEPRVEGGPLIERDCYGCGARVRAWTMARLQEIQAAHEAGCCREREARRWRKVDRR